MLWRWIERFEVNCDFALHASQIHGYFLRDMCLERLAKGVWSQLNIGRHLIVPFLRMIIGLLVHEHCSYEIFSDFFLFFFFFSVNLRCINAFSASKKAPSLVIFYWKSLWMMFMEDQMPKYILHFMFKGGETHICTFHPLILYFQPLRYWIIRMLFQTLLFLPDMSSYFCKGIKYHPPPKWIMLPFGEIVISDWTASTV